MADPRLLNRHGSELDSAPDAELSVRGLVQAPHQAGRARFGSSHWRFRTATRAVAVPSSRARGGGDERMRFEVVPAAGPEGRNGQRLLAVVRVPSSRRRSCFFRRCHGIGPLEVALRQFSGKLQLRQLFPVSDFFDLGRQEDAGPIWR